MSGTGGKERPQPEEFVRFRCPSCGAYALGPKRVSVKWNDSQKLFVVNASFLCTKCMGSLPGGDVGTLPLVIAQTSRCSCGKTLSLSRHSIKQAGDDLTFNAVYVCPDCHTRRSVVKDGLIKIVTQVWRDIKRVKVSPDGFEFEKK